eukprot:PLAT15198.1.p1 GENE.PLAT15198.1~~PLAT15198.1.p1  ORF type:complete len:510 (+),score=197.88 PLAT15198.1:1107-2636(+)
MIARLLAICALCALVGALPENPAMARSPDQWDLVLTTSNPPGEIVFGMIREWAPRGVDWVYTLAQRGYYDDNAFFGVRPGYLVQFGINPNPAVSSQYVVQNITDEPVQQDNRRGRLAFAQTHLRDSRTTQLFVSLRNNAQLDAQGFAPLGQVKSGYSVLSALASPTPAPSQARIYTDGNAYLSSRYPDISRIVSATIRGELRPAPPVDGQDDGDGNGDGSDAGDGSEAATGTATPDAGRTGGASNGAFYGGIFSTLFIAIIFVVILIWLVRKGKKDDDDSGKRGPPPGFLSAVDEQGKEYWYNPETKETMWPPEDWQGQRKQGDDDDDAGDDGLDAVDGDTRARMRKFIAKRQNKHVVDTEAVDKEQQRKAAAAAAAMLVAGSKPAALTKPKPAAVESQLLQPKPAVAIPSDWERAIDPASSKPYYYSRKTGETKWEEEMPPEIVAASTGGAAASASAAPSPAAAAMASSRLARSSSMTPASASLLASASAAAAAAGARRSTVTATPTV